jgi:iron(III) transport system ATP-binding protein
MIRPEAVHVEPDPRSKIVVTSREYFGHDQLIGLRLPDGTSLRARLGPWPVLDPGDTVSISVGEALAFAGPADE